MICTNYNNQDCPFLGTRNNCNKLGGQCDYRQEAPKDPQVFSSHKDGDLLLANLKSSLEQEAATQRAKAFEKAMAAEKAELGFRIYAEEVCRYGSKEDVAKLQALLAKKGG